MSNIFTYFTVSLPFSSRDVSIAVSRLLQMLDGDTVVILRRRHSGVCPPRGRALCGPSGDHRRCVRVGIGPHLNSCCLWFSLSISLL